MEGKPLSLCCTIKSFDPTIQRKANTEEITAKAKPAPNCCVGNVLGSSPFPTTLICKCTCADYNGVPSSSMQHMK